MEEREGKRRNWRGKRGKLVQDKRKKWSGEREEKMGSLLFSFPHPRMLLLIQFFLPLVFSSSFAFLSSFDFSYSFCSPDLFLQFSLQFLFSPLLYPVFLSPPSFSPSPSPIFIALSLYFLSLSNMFCVCFLLSRSLHGDFVSLQSVSSPLALQSCACVCFFDSLSLLVSLQSVFSTMPSFLTNSSSGQFGQTPLGNP